MRLPPDGLNHPANRRALPTSQHAPSAARALLRTEIEQQAAATLTPAQLVRRLTEDAELLVSELVTNALMHAGTEIEIAFGVETEPLVGGSSPGDTPQTRGGADGDDTERGGPDRGDRERGGRERGGTDGGGTDRSGTDGEEAAGAQPDGKQPDGAEPDGVEPDAPDGEEPHAGDTAGERAAGGGTAGEEPAAEHADRDEADPGAPAGGDPDTTAPVSLATAPVSLATAPVSLAAVLVEVADRQPTGRVTGDGSPRSSGRGLGLQLVESLAESWGVTYRRTEKAVWFRLAAAESPAATGTSPAGSLNEAVHRELEAAEIHSTSPRLDRRRSAEWSERGAAFLAEAGELLSGQLDEDLVAALAGQLLVPRIADWCAVWLTTDSGTMRLSRVWHADERKVDALRYALEDDPPPVGLRAAGTPWPWPNSADGPGDGGSALAFSLAAGGLFLGTLVIGRAGHTGLSDSAARLVEDVARRVAQAVLTARRYTRQTTISRVLQRKQLPPSLASLPGVETAIVYEPHAVGQTVGGDFYDLFPLGGNRWSFLLGDVQGHDPEAMSVTGLTRHLVRLLAREGQGVGSVLDRLNAAMAEEGSEAVAVGGESAQPRFLSLVYGELEPDRRAGGAHCALASAGHPPPLKLSRDGEVRAVVESQLLLGIDEAAEFTATGFALAPGETLLCVTDGVTERRSENRGGQRQLDDDDGLAKILRGCTGMGAAAVAERVRQATHDFGPEPVEDDLAILVLHGTVP